MFDAATLRHNRLSLIISLMVTFTFLLAITMTCGGDSATDSGAANPNTLIGPAGGTVSDPSGASVTVPAGALNHEVAISVSGITDPDNLPAEQNSPVMGFVGMADFGPDGLEFDSMVSITIPLDTMLVPGDTFPLFVWDDSCWQGTGADAVVDPSGYSVTGQVSHFSGYTCYPFMGGDGLFHGYQFLLTPQAAFDDFVTRCIATYLNRTFVVTEDGSMGCCMKTVRMYLSIDAVVGGDPFTDQHAVNDFEDYDRREVYVQSHGDIEGDYITLRLELFSAYRFTDLNTGPFWQTVDLDGPDPQGHLRIGYQCNGDYHQGGMLRLWCIGPGTMQESEIVSPADGWAEATVIPSDTGHVTVYVTNDYCTDDPEQVHLDSATIDFYRGKDEWAGTLLIQINHEAGGWTFADNLDITFFMEIDSAGNITGEGTGLHDVTVSPTECDLGPVIAPNFPVTVTGTADSTHFTFSVLPDSLEVFPVLFYLLCDNDQTIPVPAYANIEASIMGIYMEHYLPQVDQAHYEDTGTEDFGLGANVEWSYEVRIVQH